MLGQLYDLSDLYHLGDPRANVALCKPGAEWLKLPGGRGVDCTYLIGTSACNQGPMPPGRIVTHVP